MDKSLWFWALIFAVPITAIVFGTIERIFRYRALERMAERGQSIPPEMFERGHHRYYRHYRGRHTVAHGIYLMCVGVAISVFLWFFVGSPPLNDLFAGHDGWLPAVGIFPFMIGLSTLFAAMFDRRPPDGP